MEDREIVQLYLKRNSQAISETELKYTKYCISISKNILGNLEDAEECVNDAFHNAWNSIPPHKPENLAAFLGKITRNLSFDRYKAKKAKKRGGGELHIVLDELLECISGRENPEQEVDRKELAAAINGFLDSVSKEKSSIFVCRYWYAMTVTDIAKRFGKKADTISAILSRMRKGLKSYLSERGYEI